MASKIHANELHAVVRALDGWATEDECVDILRVLDTAGLVIMPKELDDTLADAALRATCYHHNFAGSALTVNRKKMQTRYRAAVAAYRRGPQDNGK